MIGTLRFYKTPSNRWYIHLAEWEGSIDELEMVEGADTMLDVVSNGTDECLLILSDEPFEGADTISLVIDLIDSIGGGDYYMETYKGNVVAQKMWLCRVTIHIFERLPFNIYVGYPETT